MEILSAYVRENATHAKYDQAKLDFQNKQKNKSTNSGKFSWPPPDIQEILLVIGRRKWRDTETDRLYLPRIKLGGGEGIEVPLGGAYLEKAFLWQADLEKAYLEGARLDTADLSEANLRGANLKNAQLDFAILRGANLEGTDFTGANIHGADFTDAIGLTSEQVKSAWNYQTAKLPQDIKVE
jgi:uncharacterized protein YjbI with pentapeptide repeats